MADRLPSKDRYTKHRDPNLEDSGDSDEATPSRVIRKKALKKPARIDDEEQLENFACTKVTPEEVIEAEAERYFAPPVTKEREKRKKKEKPAQTDEKVLPPLLSLDDVCKSFDEADPLEKEMRKKHVDSFDKWMLYLVEDANILLHGFGSKLELLEQFRQQQLAKNGYTHVVIHGYRPDATVKNLLTVLETNLLKPGQVQKTKAGIPNSLVRRALEIRDVLNAEEPIDFVIIIHSIDGLGLRDEQQQMALSYLAAINGCRILASVDHVNASLLWDAEKSNRFQWIWIDATTHANYRTEIMDGHGSKILGIRKNVSKSASGHTISGLKSIWSSLNDNSKNIFIVLAKRQLQTRKGRRRLEKLMSFGELLRACREEFIVSNEAALKLVLTEFYDHQILEQKYNDDDQEVLHVTIGDELLKEFLSSERIEIGEQVRSSENDEAAAETGQESESSNEDQCSNSEDESSEKENDDDAFDDI